MKIKLSNPFTFKRARGDLIVLLASSQPSQDVLDLLANLPSLKLREAFTTQGVLQNLSGANLVILDHVLPMPGFSEDLLNRTLDSSGAPVVSLEEFLEQSEEWLGRARLASTRQVLILPSRQVNLVNWSGGVGKTTLAMAICKRFVERTSLPAALLELSMGGCALHARVSEDLPEFFTIATQNAQPTRWQGISLYPMDGRTAEVMCPQGVLHEGEEPERVLKILVNIQKQHSLFVVDAFPGHPLFKSLSTPQTGRLNLVVTSPRDDALLQAKRLSGELEGDRYLILNMTRSLADRTGVQADVSLPFQENWAASLDHRLADPLLNLVYPGWTRRTK